jgi:gas vesicle protein
MDIATTLTPIITALIGAIVMLLGSISSLKKTRQEIKESNARLATKVDDNRSHLQDISAKQDKADDKIDAVQYTSNAIVAMLDRAAIDKLADLTVANTEAIQTGRRNGELTAARSAYDTAREMAGKAEGFSAGAK